MEQRMEEYSNCNEIEYNQLEQAVNLHMNGYDQVEVNQIQQQSDTNHQHEEQQNIDQQTENHVENTNGHSYYNYTSTHHANEQEVEPEQENLLADEKNHVTIIDNTNQSNQNGQGPFQFESTQQTQKKKKVLDLDNLKLDIVNFKRIEQSQEKKVTKRLLFVIEISSATTQYEKTVNVSYDVFSKTIQALFNFGYKFLSLPNGQCLEIQDSQNDLHVQEYLKVVRAVLQEIQQRKDLLSLEQVSSMLNLNEDKNTLDEEYLDLLNLSRKKEKYWEIVYSFFNSFGDSNLTPLSRLGRIWSFIDSQILGSVLAFRIIVEEGCVVPKYTLASKKYFDFRILCINYCQERSLLLLGSHHGYIYYQNIAPNEPLNKKSNSVQAGNEEVLQIIMFPSKQYALLLMPTSLRVFDLNSLTVVAGGSLKKRLDGQELVSAQIDSNNSQFYLGTNKGSILSYGFNNLKLDYISTFSFEEKIPISSIIHHQSYLFISSGGACTVEKIKKQLPELQLQQNGQFDLGKYMNQKQNNMKLKSPIYLSKYQLFISGSDTGMIIFWSVKDGSVLSVIQVTQDQKPIVQIQYIPTENYLLVTLQEGTKILKLGKIEDALLNEIKKSLNYVD